MDINVLNTVPANVGDTVTMRGHRNGQLALVIATYDWPTKDARIVRFDNGEKLATMPRHYETPAHVNTNPRAFVVVSEGVRFETKEPYWRVSVRPLVSGFTRDFYFYPWTDTPKRAQTESDARAFAAELSRQLESNDARMSPTLDNDRIKLTEIVTAVANAYFVWE